MRRFEAVAAAKELLNSLVEEAARTGVRREVAVREEPRRRELTRKEQEAVKKSAARMDKMIAILEDRMPVRPNQERLEVFQKLTKMETLLEFNLHSLGGSLTPRKHRSPGRVREYREVAPIQLSMGRNITPSKYKRGEGKGEAKLETSEASVIDGDKAKVKAEAQVINVYKCIKCSNAFEKINLFVKHFIQNHKDIINANRNSKNFSFSNYWSKVKVKANVESKADSGTAPEIEKKTESMIDEKKAADIKTKPAKVLGGEDRDLEMDCETVLTASSKPARKPPVKKPVRKPQEETDDEVAMYCRPIEASSCVYDVESGEEAVEKVEALDSYQCIPLEEIKLENPFECLPFQPGPEERDVLGGEEQEAKLPKVLLFEEEEVILGEAPASLVTVTGLLDSLVSLVVKLAGLGEEVEELHTLEVVDPGLRAVRHQVYIKDFSWVPLEDQFLDCDEEVKAESAALLKLRGVKCREEQVEAVKVLLLASKDQDRCRDLATRILGEDRLPRLADHGQGKTAIRGLV